MVFSGTALGQRNESHPINTLRAGRKPLEASAQMQGF
jgi:hypothetical protein